MQIRACSGCKKVKPFSAFDKDKTRKGGVGYLCKTCRKEYQQSEAGKRGVKKYQQSKKGKLVKERSRLKFLYGITLAEYDQMIETQNGVCAICGDINPGGRRLCVDHNHKTGEVRGLLCIKCNGWLGKFENMIYCQAAKNYLNKSK